MTVADANRITDFLKETCDPRGHELVDAIGELLRSMADALEAIQKEAEPERPGTDEEDIDYMRTEDGEMKVLRSPW